MSSLSLIRRSRKNGITQLKDGTEYEIQRIRRIKRKKELNRAALQAAAAANVEVRSGAISYRGAFQRFSTIITPNYTGVNSAKLPLKIVDSQCLFR